MWQFFLEKSEITHEHNTIQLIDRAVFIFPDLRLKALIYQCKCDQLKIVQLYQKKLVQDC